MHLAVGAGGGEAEADAELVDEVALRGPERHRTVELEEHVVRLHRPTLLCQVVQRLGGGDEEERKGNEEWAPWIMSVVVKIRDRGDGT